MLRALCQLVNTTELTLEACLVDLEDGDWHMVAARAGKGMAGGPACLLACNRAQHLADSTSLPPCPVRELGTFELENNLTCFCFLSRRCLCLCRPFPAPLCRLSQRHLLR